ncbi:MAG: tRNA glutamyl-Q(34) synthetase GluQRS [Gammaproteobacteria bacterium]|nr:tRNA glutamyl-Q(34) synthetase GluQRS [Gammaproteobacteria bacterium]
MTQNKPVVGRFAPSPSGPLHFGSLIAAVGSYLIAKSAGGKWLVRIEDIDPPREVPGAADQILRQLEAFGFEWDGEVLYQSTRLERYQEVLNDLYQRDLIYACDCTRKKIQEKAINHLYPNICADKNLPLSGQVAWRMRHGAGNYSFHDGIKGHCQFDKELYQEDFTVRRKDGLIAYQLAVVVDDIEQGINQVVRGEDILDSTPRQLRLYEALGATPPEFYHLPLALNKDGNKLSKQNHAQAIEPENASELLIEALKFLNLKKENVSSRMSPSEILIKSI